jgi:hypothetical protein
MNETKSNKPRRRRDEDQINIKIKGPKRFRQAFIDRIYDMLMEEDFLEASTRPGCGYTLESTIEPSEVRE